MITRADLRSALRNPNVRAFLSVIRHGEGTAGNYGYRTMFGGETFDGYAWHPNRKVTKTVGGKPLTSTAAGAYQFLFKTWEGLVNRYGFEDFSPECQDEAAVALIAIRHALQDVVDGHFSVAIDKCAEEWASLPGSPYGQPTMTMDRARDIYVKYGGLLQAAVEERPMLDTVAAAAPVEEHPAVPTLEEKHMPAPFLPFLGLALDAITTAVPALIDVFGDKGKSVPERNIVAAMKVVDTVKTAIGASNEQEVVEKLQADPAAAGAAREAVQSIWFEITGTPETLKAARDADTAFAEKGSPLWRSPAFVISSVLLALVFMLAADVFFIHPGTYSGDLRTQIVTAFLLIIGMVSQYWIGTSYSSSRKTDMLAGKTAS